MSQATPPGLNTLSSNGIWLRQRDGLWQAKIRQGGNISNLKFEEITDLIEIARHVRAFRDGNDNPNDYFGLEKLAALTTFRQSWLADDEFSIVLDRTDFGHTVGEVELQYSMQFEHGAQSTIARLKDTKMNEIDGKIIHFTNHYSWVFCKESPKGKLTAVFEQAGDLKSR